MGLERRIQRGDATIPCVRVRAEGGFDLGSGFHRYCARILLMLLIVCFRVIPATNTDEGTRLFTHVSLNVMTMVLNPIWSKATVCLTNE